PPAAVAQVVSCRGVFTGAAVLAVALGISCWICVREQREECAFRPHFSWAAIRRGLLGVLANRATWRSVCVNFGLAGSFFAFAGVWATPYLTQVHQLDRVTAASHLSLYFAGFAVGCFAIGSLSDRIGRRKPVLIVGSLLYCALWIVWLSAVRMPVG